MARVNEGSFVCDVCKTEWPLYPNPPQTLVVRGSNQTDLVVPDTCHECQSAIADFIGTIQR